MMDDLDDVDEAFIASLVPPGAIVTGVAAIVSWVDPDTGGQRWRNWCRMDLPVSSVIGLYELGKLDLIARSDTGLPISYEED